MKIAVVCANGRVGRLVVKEAVERGLCVTAISRAFAATTLIFNVRVGECKNFVLCEPDRDTCLRTGGKDSLNIRILKVPLAKYRNPAWAQKFAFLMGRAAALDLVVGRRNSITKDLLFDQNYEVVTTGADGMPEEIRITDHAGSFVDYERPFADFVAEYAAFATRRKAYVTEYPTFVAAYVEGFRRHLAETHRYSFSPRASSRHSLRRRSPGKEFSTAPWNFCGEASAIIVLRRVGSCQQCRAVQFGEVRRH